MKKEIINYYQIDYILNIKIKTYDYKKEFGDYTLNEPTKQFIELLINTYYGYIDDELINIDSNNEKNKKYINELLKMFPNNNSKLYKDLEACIFDNSKFDNLIDDFFRLSSCKNVEINKS